MSVVEQWLPIAGYEGLYEVSDQGRVKSLDRIITFQTGGSFIKPGRTLKHLINTNGRHQVALCAKGNQRMHQVHCLVAQAFIGSRPPGLAVLHWDDNPDNNCAANLRYGTLSANQYDRVRNGNHPAANKTHCKRGHAFSSENTRYDAKGRRSCRVCSRILERARGPRVRDRRRKVVT